MPQISKDITEIVQSIVDKMGEKEAENLLLDLLGKKTPIGQPGKGSSAHLSVAKELKKIADMLDEAKSHQSSKDVEAQAYVHPKTKETVEDINIIAEKLMRRIREMSDMFLRLERKVKTELALPPDHEVSKLFEAALEGISMGEAKLIALKDLNPDQIT